MKKLVFKIDMPDKAMETVARYPGIDSISIDMEEQTLTIFGTINLMKLISRLSQFWTVTLVSVALLDESKMKEVLKKEELKKEELKKEETATDKKQPAPADEAKNTIPFCPICKRT